MKKFLLIIGLPILLTGVTIVVLPSIMPQDSIKSFLAEQVQAKMGRELNINGNLHWQLIPQIQIKVEDVSLTNADWAKEPYLMEIGAIQLHIALSPLLQSQIQIDQLMVSDALIHLATNRTGKSNWEFATDEPEATPQPLKQESSDGWSISMIQDIAVNRTQITIDDQQLGIRREITDFEFNVPQFNLSSPIQMTGKFLIDGKAAELSGMVSQPKALIGKGITQIALNLDIPGAIHAQINGDLGIKDDWTQTQGDINVNLDIPDISPDIRRLLANLSHMGGNEMVSTHITRLKSLNVNIDMKQSRPKSGSAKLNVKMNYDGNPIQFVANLSATETDLLQANIKLDSQEVELSYSGEIKFGAQTQADGQYKIRIASAQKLASYFNYNKKLPIPLKAINISGTVEMLGQQLKLSVNSNLNIRNEPVQLTLNLSSKDITNAPIDTQGKIRMPGLMTDIHGNVVITPTPRINGQIGIQINSLRDSLAWWDIPPPTSISADKISLESTLDLTDDYLKLTQLKITQSKQTLAGDLHLSGIGTQNQLEGKLTATNLSLDSAPRLGNSSRPAKPRIAGKKWDNTPIDLTSLQTYKVKLTLDMTNADLYGLKIDHAKAYLQADQGDISLEASALNLYDGTGSINLQLNTQAKPLVLMTKIGFSNLSIRPLVTDLTGLSKLGGTLKINSSIRMHGNSQSELIRSLTGTGQFTAQNGIIYGVNIPNKIYNILSLLTRNNKADQWTEYDKIEGSWKIAEGKLQNNDFLLSSDALNIPGAGSVNFPTRTLDYQLQAHLTSLPLIQHTLLKGKKVIIPVRIVGTWDNPSIRPDLTRVKVGFNPPSQ